VTVSINSVANGFEPASYSDTVTFTDGDEYYLRRVTLLVSGPIEVSPTTFSPEPGYYSTAQSVTLSTTTPDATIRYTMDGSTPNSNVGMVYTGPVLLSTTTTIRAVAYIPGVAISTVSSGTYTFPPQTVGTLEITPGGLSSSGSQGGPFSPSSISYTLSNPGGTSIGWTAGNTQPWVTLSSTGGMLASGGTATVTVSINSGANSLAAGNYSDTVTFTNTTNGFGSTLRFVGLTVTGPLPVVQTQAASPVTMNGAQLNGSVIPNSSLASAWFEWGTSSSLPTYNTTEPIPIIDSGTTAIPVNFILTGLSPETTYYYRVACQNIAGIFRATNIVPFTTLTTGQGVTGTWFGTYTTSLINNPPADLTLLLTQTGSSVTGTYSTSTNVGGSGGGTFSGTANGAVITFTMNQTTPECPGTFSGTSNVTGNTMNFTFTDHKEMFW
jgi:hypothetical protein